MAAAFIYMSSKSLLNVKHEMEAREMSFAYMCVLNVTARLLYFIMYYMNIWIEIKKKQAIFLTVCVCMCM